MRFVLSVIDMPGELSIIKPKLQRSRRAYNNEDISLLAFPHLIKSTRRFLTTAGKASARDIDRA
jgi:hypothetical protein